MPADPDFKIASLIPVGPRVINACYLILSEQVGAKGDPAGEVQITMEAGIRIRLRGEEARLWVLRLASLVPGQPEPAEVAPGVGGVGGVAPAAAHTPTEVGRKRKVERPPQG